MIFATSETSGYRPQIIQRAFVGFIGARLHPFWSLTTPKLRLLARHALSEDLITLQFETNYAFRQQATHWQGGQHISLSVLIEGIYHQRHYSLVGLAQQPLWWDDVKDNAHKSHHKQARHTVTIAIKPQGVVSNYLTKQAPLGAIFDSSAPDGDFTLASAPISESLSPLLFIAGGSGITPMLGLITQALQRGHQVTLLHYNRTLLLGDYWQNLAVQYPALTYHLINTNDSTTYLANGRHLSTQALLALSLPLADTVIFACGSHTLLQALYRSADEISAQHADLLSRAQSLRASIFVENFGHAVDDLDNSNLDNNNSKPLNAAPKTIYLRARQRHFSSSSTLLMDAEKAGLRLKHGCRQGICHLCSCNKISGVVKNLHTGKLSGDGFEAIQTCITVAMSDVVLDS